MLIAGGTCWLFGFASAKKGFLFVEAKIFGSFCAGKQEDVSALLWVNFS